MRTIYLATYESAQKHLVKTLEQERRKANMLCKAIDLLEGVKHYKSITKRVTDVVKDDSFYCYIQADFSFRVKFILTKRTFGESSDYFESYEETLYFGKEEEQTPAVLLAKLVERLMQLRENEKQIEKDLKGFKKIFEEAHKLATEYNCFSEKYSYTIQNALEI